MIGGQWMQFRGTNIDFDNLSDDELDEIVGYSEDEDTLTVRYALACHVIANLIEEFEPESLSNMDMVDFTICKMLIDGHIEIERKNESIH